MAIKKFKPTTPSLRTLTVLDASALSENNPEKSLTKGSSKSGGRGTNGRISVRHIGGGHKQKYRAIDFKRNKIGISAKVVSI